MAKVREIRLFIESDWGPWEKSLIEAIEEKMPHVRVVASATTRQCLMCSESEEVVTHWGRERKKWWQFWKFSRVPNSYYFSSEHSCRKESAKKYAEPGDPWWRQATGTVEPLR